MANALPELLTPCYGQNGKPFTPNYPHYSSSELMNPMRNQTFAFLKELFREFKGVFKDDYIHLGIQPKHHLVKEVVFEGFY